MFGEWLLSNINLYSYSKVVFRQLSSPRQTSALVLTGNMAMNETFKIR